MQVPILAYHSIDESGSVISTSREAFREQMEAIKAWGYRGVSLSTLLSMWQSGATLTTPCAALTFDDAYLNGLEVAAPILKESGFTATFFAVPSYCGKNNQWPTQPSNIPVLPTMGVSQLRELRDFGCEVGAHTMTHPHLPTLTKEEAKEELVRSKHWLEDQLGTSVSLVSYPYGESTATVRSIAQQHFRAGCGVTLRNATCDDDRYDLPRIEMYYFRNPSIFRRFPTLAGQMYLRARSVARSIRLSLCGRRS